MDAGENGRVSYRIRKEEFHLPMISATLSEKHATGRYPEAELDHSRQPVMINSDVEAVEMFRVRYNYVFSITLTFKVESECSYLLTFCSVELAIYRRFLDGVTGLRFCYFTICFTQS